MKKVFFAILILLALVTVTFAESPACISSGLKTSDAAITTATNDAYHCLCGVQLIPAAADSYVILYDAASATGTALIKVTALAAGTPTGYAPNGQCIRVNTGIYADVNGADAAFIVWYR